MFRKLFWASARLFLRPTVSLEWGSDRSSQALKSTILSEKQVESSSKTYSKDPVTKRVFYTHHPKPVIYSLKDVTYDPADGGLGTQGHRISESSHPDFQPLYAWDASRRRRKTREAPAPATAMRVSANYYHFLMEDLPRLILLRKHSLVQLLYTSAAALEGFASEALDSLGISVVHLPTAAKIDRLFFVGRLGPLFNPSELAQDLVRTEFLPPPTSEEQRRDYIYLSRKFSSRSLRNENQIEEWASSKGFEIVYAERLSLAEQIDKFARARLVLAPHGAGLANLAFMPTGGTVFEIMSRSYTNPVFKTLSENRLQHHQILIDGDSVETAFLDEKLREHQRQKS